MITSKEVIAELEARVSRRRQEGKYPPGLEQQLEAEFKGIMDVVHRGTDVLGGAQGLLEECKIEISNINGYISDRSRIPGFSLVHRLIRKIVGRQTSAITVQVRSTLEKQQKVLELLVQQLEIQKGTDSRVLNQLSHAMIDRLMMIDVLAQSVLDLERQISKDS